MNKTQKAYIAQSVIYSGIVFVLALIGFIFVVMGKNTRDYGIAIGPLSFALMVQIYIGFFFNPIYTRAKLRSVWAKVILILMTIAFLGIILLFIYSMVSISGARNVNMKAFSIAVLCLAWTTMLPYFFAILVYAIGHSK